MLFGDQKLASRIEAALSRQSRGFCEAALRSVPELGAEMLALGLGVQATYYGPGSVLSRVSGLGIEAPATVEQAMAAEEFYFSRGEICKIELCPLVDAEQITLLRERGYGVRAFTSVFFRETPADGEDLGSAPGVSTRIVSGDELDRVLDAIHTGFGGSPTDVMRRHMGVARHVPSVRQLGAYVDGAGMPAGGGSMEIIGGTALLFGASTLPAYRGQGVQSSLIRARLGIARDSAGCDLVVIQSRPGLPSERNILRHGFRLAYTRPVLSKEPPGGRKLA